LSDGESEVRVDKWLWAARFFKTRGLAAEAVSGGKIHVNGQRCKPSKELRLGDRVEIHKDQLCWSVTVVSLRRQRCSAALAMQMYSEDQQSYDLRQQTLHERKLQREALGANSCAQKPNKKQRRQIHCFKQKTL
jgi:ribosome-associated heat shock protein Hsp15